jgi:hypothetical protein
MAIQVANASGDPAVFDAFNFDTIIRDSAGINGTPESWLASEDEVAAKRQQRQQAAERQQQAQEAPAKAALMKAGAAQAKAGMVPGQLGQAVGPNQMGTQGPQQ